MIPYAAGVRWSCALGVIPIACRSSDVRRTRFGFSDALALRRRPRVLRFCGPACVLRLVWQVSFSCVSVLARGHGPNLGGLGNRIPTRRLCLLPICVGLPSSVDVLGNAGPVCAGPVRPLRADGDVVMADAGRSEDDADGLAAAGLGSAADQVPVPVVDSEYFRLRRLVSLRLNGCRSELHRARVHTQCEITRPTCTGSWT